jgi:3-hydroxyisobutyrate dehydrogenase-like beta-hydroxyacid dehydrogenase
MSAAIHFLGVGKMGLPMAGHLHAAGHRVTVSDPSPEREQLAAAQGLQVAAAADGLSASAVVFSSLPHDAALLDVARQLVRSARRGSLWVDTSTVSQQASAEAAELCAAAGITAVRVTVSGNNKMAEAAQLTVMASGPRAAYEQVLPLLSVLGPNHFYLGQAEEARLMKLVVNLLIAQTSAMLSEGLTLGRLGGLSWEDMWQVLGASAVGSPILKAKSVQLSAGDFTPTFTVEQMIKDLDLILAAGAAVKAPLAQVALTQQLMHTAVAQGDGQLDYAAIIRALERSAGLSPSQREKS